jgi:hypothetical protein
MALPPLACPPLPMFLIWHLRHQADPLQMWLRAAIERGVAPALAAARAGSVLAEAPPAAGVPAT